MTEQTLIMNEQLALEEHFTDDRNKAQKTPGPVNFMEGFADTFKGLHLDNAKINDSSIHAISQRYLSYQASNQDNALLLSNNEITATGIQSLSVMLSENPHIRFINLAHNTLYDEGITYLGGCLRTHKVIEQLDLTDTHIGDFGAIYLADVLMAQSSLTFLDLSHNDIQTEGAQALFEMLKHNDTIQTLSLRGNIIEREAFYDLCHVLMHRHTPLVLDLQDIPSLDHDIQDRLLDFAQGSEIQLIL